MILQTVTSDNPDFRYVVGKDSAMVLEARTNIPDREFQDLIKKQLLIYRIDTGDNTCISR
jgi:hypothetical protein